MVRHEVVLRDQGFCTARRLWQHRFPTPRVQGCHQNLVSRRCCVADAALSSLEKCSLTLLTAPDGL